MKEIIRDPQLAAKEKEERNLKVQEQTKRNEYLKVLKNNADFKKYVIDGIIKKHIDELTDIRNIKNADFNNMEEVGKLVIQAKASRTILEKILYEIIN